MRCFPHDARQNSQKWMLWGSVEPVLSKDEETSINNCVSPACLCWLALDWCNFICKMSVWALSADEKTNLTFLVENYVCVQYWSSEHKAVAFCACFSNSAWRYSSSRYSGQYKTFVFLLWAMWVTVDSKISWVKIDKQQRFVWKWVTA